MFVAQILIVIRLSLKCDCINDVKVNLTSSHEKYIIYIIYIYNIYIYYQYLPTFHFANYLEKRNS